MELGKRPRRDKRPRPYAPLRPRQEVPRHAKAGGKHDGCTCSKGDAPARSHRGMTVTSSCLNPGVGRRFEATRESPARGRLPPDEVAIRE